MEFEIVLKRRFSNHLHVLLSYLEKEWGVTVANNFFERINSVLDLLKKHPFAGAESKQIKGARSILVTKHNRLVYGIKENKISIVALFDTRTRNYT